jgi:hypothetical protein
MAVEASVRIGTLARVGEKGPRARGFLIHRIRAPKKREAPNLPNFAYLPPAYLAQGNWRYGLLQLFQWFRWWVQQDSNLRPAD